jgi:predicted nicotinamide N-methyase
MTYPTILFPFEQDKTIHIPDPEKIKDRYLELNSKDNTTPFPFWARIWPSAHALTTYLKDNLNFIQSKNVLEIGAGIGLPSFSIAEKAKEVIITDHSNEAIKLIQKNIDHLNLSNAKAARLDWNNFPIDFKVDTILLSDINYDPTQIEPLIKLIQYFSSSGSTVIISTPERITATSFAVAIQPLIKHSVLQTVQESEVLQEIRIMML